jgi:hypothetical protein
MKTVAIVRKTKHFALSKKARTSQQETLQKQVESTLHHLDIPQRDNGENSATTRTEKPEHDLAFGRKPKDRFPVSDIKTSKRNNTH